MASKLQAPNSTTVATQADLINGYSSNNFYVVNGDEVAFNQSGASMRTELRYLNNWTISQDDRYLHANLKIAQQTNDQVTFMQIHDDANVGSGPNKPLARIYKHKTKAPADHLWLAYKTDASGLTTSHIDLGLAPTEYFDCDINIIGERLIVLIDGVEKADIDVSFWTFLSYWKAGVYLQDAGEATMYFNELTEGILDTNPCIGESIVMDEGFNNSLGTFSYVSGIFTSPNSTYESASLNASNVTMQVGGVNNNNINNLSLGVISTFEKSIEGTTTVNINYVLSIAAAYESNEYAEVRVEIDGAIINYNGNPYLYRIGGNDPTSSGAQEVTLTIPDLAVGAHTIEIGVYNNRKTYNDEISTLLLDNLRISESCPQSTTSAGQESAAGSVLLKQNIESPKFVHKIYPNPFKEYVYITLNPDLEYTRVSIYTLQGLLVQDLNDLGSFKEDRLRLHLTGGSGTYVVLIESNEGLDVHRILQLDN